MKTQNHWQDIWRRATLKSCCGWRNHGVPHTWTRSVKQLSEDSSAADWILTRLTQVQQIEKVLLHTAYNDKNWADKMGAGSFLTNSKLMPGVSYNRSS